MKRTKQEESGGTREAILDATEQIMREEGYAAVSSRRVAARAGLRSQLVHYHFGTMEDLFLALFRRAEAQHFERHLQAMTAVNPVRELWRLSTDRNGIGLIFEFMALANRSERLRREIARANLQTRSMQTALLGQALQARGVPPERCPPAVLSLLMAGAALQIVTEEAIDVTAAHAETMAFVEQLLAQMEQSPQPAKRAAAGSRRKAGTSVS